MCVTASDGAVELVGNRTECGLLQMAAALGADYEAIRREGRVLRMFPFSSERKRMTSLVSQPGSRSAPSSADPTDTNCRAAGSCLDLYGLCHNDMLKASSRLLNKSHSPLLPGAAQSQFSTCRVGRVRCQMWCDSCAGCFPLDTRCTAARDVGRSACPDSARMRSVSGMLCGRLYTKGAAELLLQQCSSRLVDGAGAECLSQREKDDILHSFAADGNR